MFLLLGAILFAVGPAFGQKRIHLKCADQLRSEKKKHEQFDRLLGNVVLTHDSTTIYCDSAYFYKKKNYIEAFGQVRVVTGDSITLSSSKVEYDGNTKKARVHTK
jgi:lipopolysaccharide assembly outer membrane protein LptD (OstA)